jgi:cytochrome b involved in lipid metabolism
MSSKCVSRDEVSKHNTEDDCWVIIDNKVYDVTKWLPHHPGGKNLILNLAGTDVTEEFKVFHLNPCYARLRPFLIGEVSKNDIKEISPLAKDVAQLSQKLKKQGAFKPDYLFHASRGVIILALFYGCLYFLQFPSVLSTIISAFCLGLCWQQFAFTGHDLGHHGVTHDFKLDHKLGFVIGNAMQGISLAWWRHNHNTHHTITNSITYDPDIQHVPFLAVSSDFFKNLTSKYYNRTMKFDSVAKWFISSQHFWFYPVMMLARFNLYAQSYIFILAGPGSLSKERNYELASLIFFATWLTYLLTFTASFGHAILFLLVSHAVAGIVHVQICINHFPMETFEGLPQKAYETDGYIKSQLVTTTNIECSPFMDFFHGGLQFQVEHHLFPHLTRSWLRYTQGEVRKICKKHNLPYYTRSFFGANYDVLVKLKEISREARLADIFMDGLNMNG